VSHGHSHAHGHSHGLVDPSIVRSKAGLRAVTLSLGVLGLTAALQALVFAAASPSVSLLGDLIHNGGDALTAIPLGAAFLLRSHRAEHRAGVAVVLVVFASACVALYETIERFIHPQTVSHLGILAAAGVVGFAGNAVAASIRSRAGKRLQSPALIADGSHARVDALVSLGVVASAGLVAAGAHVADPFIGLAITAAILRVSWSSWRTVR
jgi:cation diffusion facilitator family transporter